MTPAQQKLIKAASLDPAITGTRWRDRMDRWLDEDGSLALRSMMGLLTSAKMASAIDNIDPEKCIAFAFRAKRQSKRNGIYSCKAGPWKRKPSK